jgi:hypothetical protein
LVILLVALAIGGCGGDEEATSTTPPLPSIDAPENTLGPPRCLPADSNLMTPLGNGMKDDQARLKNGRAVKSDDHAKIFFVSAEVYGSGVSDGTIGTWATTSLGGAEAIWTVDDVSKQYSDLRDGTTVADLSMDDDGVEESRACVESAP